MDDVRRRGLARGAVTTATGVATFASACAAGVFAGLAGRDSAADQQAAPPAPVTGDAAQGVTADGTRPRPVVRWRDRPRKVVVRTRTVYRTLPDAVGGGSVDVLPASSGSGSSGRPPAPSSSGSGGSGGPGGGRPAPPPPAPPPPPPPPAPSSGS